MNMIPKYRLCFHAWPLTCAYGEVRQEKDSDAVALLEGGRDEEAL
jgi:hypothetical protein